MNHFSWLRRAAWVPLLASFAAGTPVYRGSGTYLLLRRMQELRAQGKPMALAKTASLGLSGRVYRSAHFAFHYTLAPNVHRPLFTPRDSSLLRQINALLQALPSSLSTSARDSTINAAFADSVAPYFVQRAAYHFERYWSYFADTLGMDMPTGGSSSQVFTGSSDGARYTVDICDIGTAQPTYWRDEIYGLTWPQPAISTMLENDFLWQASADSNGKVTGQPIQAVVNGQVLHDYTVDWDMGIEVTAIHEFYHGIQFTYVAEPANGTYHDWYELSSTGMEEVLAPEVNDYFQYLPCLFQNHDRIPLIQSDNGVCNFPPMFGFGVFHQYLTYTLGKKFDVVLWSALRSNGDDLPAALQATARYYHVSWDSLYAEFSAALASAGRGSTAACADANAPVFLRDRPCWPMPAFDSLPVVGDSLRSTLQALTFQLFSSPPTGTEARFTWSGTMESIPQKIAAASPYAAEAVSGNPLVFLPSPDNSVLGLSLPNASFTAAGSLSVVLANAQGFTVFPSPARLSAGDVFFTLPPGLSGPLTLTIVSETGRRVAELPLNAQTSLWTWNLTDEQGRPVPPGVYFYSTPGQAPETLPLLPR